MKLPVTTRFIEKGSGKRMEGLIRIATEHDLLLWTGWRYRPSDEDRTWDWWSLYLECKASNGRYECYAAFMANDLQGLAVLDLKPRRTRFGRAIALDYLATNPANRHPNYGFKHVGVALVAVAVARSLESGAEGSIWLESLVGAANFYESLAMAKQPHRSIEGNLVYILEPAIAEQLLEEIKARGIVDL